jgi:hypothetical protein
MPQYTTTDRNTGDQHIITLPLLSQAVEKARAIAQRTRGTQDLTGLHVSLTVPPDGHVRPIGVEKIEGSDR